MENKGNISIINIKKSKEAHYDMYIGRTNVHLNLTGGKWANPFVMKAEFMRPGVLRDYEEYIRARPDLLKALPELAGKTLACYCCNYSNNVVVGKECHGLVLVKLYDEFVKP